MRILSVFGTRPEAIKMAPLVLALGEAEGIDTRVCVTGQHRQMLDDVMSAFSLKADYDLNIMRPNQSLSEVFSAVMTGIDPVIADYNPDYVLVQGDTATSTAAALAAFFRSVSVGHVEAGLRTGNLMSPWPEEANRRVTAVVTTRHYAPTLRARSALLKEGYPPDAVIVTGNTVIDGLLRMASNISQPGELRRSLEAKYSWLDTSKRLVLVTGHRRESFGSGFRQICEALKTISRRDDIQIVYPVHLNPNVRGPVFDHLRDASNIFLIEPLNYPEFVYLMTRSYLILTDSGGIQEEAPALRKPVLVMRDTSERMEAVDAGVARLVTTDPARIVAGVERLLDVPAEHEAMALGANPFGDGRASKLIVRDLLNVRRPQRPTDHITSVNGFPNAEMHSRPTPPLSQPAH
ncbi:MULTISPECIES: non-hydrolyzing UDP-N-acetylglucosamine 2-epimerase [unclassified Bradyrhizobium]|uniref:non-hydrolyzing UDP-N-acetylglucosamine 2-epimerase n=1 Tax=unclassified Bradyrhizobium TaxID=2631580 RepID=UPI0020A06743|nr:MULTISPECIES: UDP-N-acetylglucosamine 2-epimerase (non-hydrolyzing) [unclassified Bradyrhizobium]